MPHALKPLFAAYEALLNEGDQWLDEALAEFENAADLRKDYEGVQRGRRKTSSAKNLEVLRSASVVVMASHWNEPQPRNR